MNAEKENQNLIVSRPVNHMEVEGELCKLFYQRFGDEALPIIEAVFHEWGTVIGEGLKAKVPAGELKVAAETYLKPTVAREPKPKIIEATNERFEIKVFTCPYRLNGAGRLLCEAMSAMDKAAIETLVGAKVEMKQIKTLAAPEDECCHGVITRKTP